MKSKLFWIRIKIHRICTTFIVKYFRYHHLKCIRKIIIQLSKNKLWLHKYFNPIVFVFNNHGNSSITLFVLCWVICSHSLHTFFWNRSIFNEHKLTSASNSFLVYSNAFLFDEINHLKNNDRWPALLYLFTLQVYLFQWIYGERGIFQFSLVLTTATQTPTHIPLENVGIACAHTAALVLIVVGRGGGAGAGALLAGAAPAADSRHQFSALCTGLVQPGRATPQSTPAAARTPAL